MTALQSSSEGQYEGLEEVLAIALATSWGAADILRSYYRGEPHTGDLNIQNKKDGPVTAADLAVNHYILDNLQAYFGSKDFGYLSEETYKSQVEAHGKAPLPQPWVWIIDPLDGTRDFIDKTGEYAVHIALTHQGRPILSVVAYPENEKIYFATKGGGAFVETREGERKRLQVSQRDRLEDLPIVVSRTHRDERFNYLLQKLPCKQQKYVGSVGCKIATLVEQKADLYISLSGKSGPKDWDMAAPELILTEAGGKFTHADGTPLMYNQGDVTQWGCLIASNGHCHPILCDMATTILAEWHQS